MEKVRAKVQGVPEETLNLIDIYLEDCARLLQSQMQPSQPMQAAMPPGMQAPQGPPQPQPQPMPAPPQPGMQPS